MLKLKNFKKDESKSSQIKKGDLEDRGVASIVTSLSSSGTISMHLLSSAVSSLATSACTFSSNFYFLELSYSISSPALLELPSITSA
uniref:Uncharacterized protein n=1 Tax=Tanacetum cinerariifolium TaxID=118510 RepID=A0A6L2NU39_TANCI|nr:hypothetical protein [Tanacetum cinerariifolium]